MNLQAGLPPPELPPPEWPPASCPALLRVGPAARVAVRQGGQISSGLHRSGLPPQGLPPPGLVVGLPPHCASVAPARLPLPRMQGCQGCPRQVCPRVVSIRVVFQLPLPGLQGCPGKVALAGLPWQGCPCQSCPRRVAPPGLPPARVAPRWLSSGFEGVLNTARVKQIVPLPVDPGKCRLKQQQQSYRVRPL